MQCTRCIYVWNTLRGNTFTGDTFRCDTFTDDTFTGDRFKGRYDANIKKSYCRRERDLF